MSWRVKAYAAVWVLLVASVSTLLATRSDVDVLVLRQPGTLFTTTADGQIANFYTLQVFNRTDRPVNFSLEILEPAGGQILRLGPFDQVGPHALLESRFLLQVPPDRLTSASTPVRIGVRTDGVPASEITTRLLGPAKD